MAFRIGDYICSGELDNSRRNSVRGWIDFGNEQGLKLELTGNLPGEFSGRHFRFVAKEPQARTDECDQVLDAMEMQQVGTIGDVLLHVRKVPTCSTEELKQQIASQQPLEFREQPVLYLEWYSQNGRVVAEIIGPEISWVQDDDTQTAADLTPDPLPDENDGPQGGPQITAFTQNEHGFIEELPLSDAEAEAPEDDDPYGLFPPDLDEQLAMGDDSAAPTAPADKKQRDWADVIPGIDQETKALYEQWDEILHGENHEPVTSLFDPPITLPPAETLTEDEAAGHLKTILARLAEFCIAIDMCEHATALNTYRWLLTDILPQARFTKASVGSGFVQHYSTFDDCPECEAEFEAEWAARKRQQDNSQQDNSEQDNSDQDNSDQDPDEEVPW